MGIRPAQKASVGPSVDLVSDRHAGSLWTICGPTLVRRCETPSGRARSSPSAGSRPYRLGWASTSSHRNDSQSWGARRLSGFMDLHDLRWSGPRWGCARRRSSAVWGPPVVSDEWIVRAQSMGCSRPRPCLPRRVTRSRTPRGVFPDRELLQLVMREGLLVSLLSALTPVEVVVPSNPLHRGVWSIP
jgi:hypothetical protein